MVRPSQSALAENCRDNCGRGDGKEEERKIHFSLLLLQTLIAEMQRQLFLM